MNEKIVDCVEKNAHATHKLSTSKKLLVITFLRLTHIFHTPIITITVFYKKDGNNKEGDRDKNMKLRIEKNEFIKWWQFAERITNPKNQIASLGGVYCVAMDGGVVLEATDLKTSIRCVAQGVSASENGSVILPAKLLGELMKRVPTNEFSIDVVDEKGTLTSGKNKTKFSTWAVADFPKIPSARSAQVFCEMKAGDLLRIISEGSVAGNHAENFPTYIATCFFQVRSNVIRAVSTDSHRLALSDAECTAPEDAEMLLPVLPVRELQRLLSSVIPEAVVRVLTDGSVAWFQMGDMEFSIRRVEASFPVYEKILNPNKTTNMVVNRDKIVSALERVEIIVRDSTRVVVMKMSEGEPLRISGKSPNTGTVVEYVDAAVTGIPLKIGFNISYIQDGLKAFQSEDVKFGFDGGSGQMALTAPNRDDFLYMTMPVSISEDDDIEEENADS